jgi:transcriptional regulator with XRE-family HTH domain
MKKPYTLADFIKNEIARRRISARKFADELHVGHTTINRIVKGERPSITFLEKLCAYTHTDLETLVLMVSPELAARHRMSPRARALGQQLDRLPENYFELLDRLIAGGELYGEGNGKLKDS